MDLKLKEYLHSRGIFYKEHKHKAVFTVNESKSIKKDIPGLLTKNLFLKDEKNNYYLVCMNANKRLNMKSLESILRVKKLTFSSPEELKKELNLSPGSVSIFGMIYSKNVFLIIDREVWEAEVTGFHPNINTSTLEISHSNLEKFVNSLNCKKMICDLE